MRPEKDTNSVPLLTEASSVEELREGIPALSRRVAGLFQVNPTPEAIHYVHHYAELIERYETYSKILVILGALQRERQCPAELKPLLPKLDRKVVSQFIGGCTCLTKTPAFEYHDVTCRYRVMAEVSVVLGAIKKGVL